MVSTIYIPKEFVNKSFDKETGITLNLNAENLFTFKENGKKLIIKKNKNEDFVPKKFWSSGIERINAIVGKNGTGKTSILRYISTNDILFANCLFVLRIKDEIIILNKSDFEIDINFQARIETKFDDNFKIFYYSPILDVNLKQTNSPVNLSNYFNNNLEEYYVDSLLRQVLLQNNVDLVTNLKNQYKDFPIFEQVTISIEKFVESFFLNPYIQSNFANPNTGESVLNTTINPEIDNIRDGYREVDKDYILKLLEHVRDQLKSKSYSQRFKDLWGLEKYNYRTKTGYLAGEFGIVNDYEKIVLSYLILDCVFPQTGLSGGVTNFSFLNNESTFEEKLNGFISLFIDNYFGIWYSMIENEFGEIDFKKIDDYIAIIEKDKISKIRGWDLIGFKKSLFNSLRKVQLYYSIYEIIKDKVTDSSSNEITFDVKTEFKKFNELIEKFKALSSIFHNPVNFKLLKFSTNKLLSSGENALLDLISSFHQLIIKNNNQIIGKNALVLLDEAELGFHPSWKKKFLKVIDSTFPNLFKIVNEEYKIQIIFTTHDPLTLSDMPSPNVIFLDKDAQNRTILSSREKGTFGANISDLLEDSFFLEDGLIGDFAKEKITETIDWLNDHSRDKEKSAYFKQIIELIDEPILQTKLAEMYDEAIHPGENSFSKKIIQDEINRLNNKLNEI